MIMTYLDEIPFHYVGKGEQSIVKTNLALSHKKSQEASIILLEEPENHLSHSKLNELIKRIKGNIENKQIILSTHSSFVANKLGLDHLILLNDLKHVRLNQLFPDTKAFFSKLSGYDTLRLILIAAAGSGKTTFLVDEALKQSRNVLITTYTEANESEIKNRIVQKNKFIPSNIAVQTWFSFLIQHGVKPYQGHLT